MEKLPSLGRLPSTLLVAGGLGLAALHTYNPPPEKDTRLACNIEDFEPTRTYSRDMSLEEVSAGLADMGFIVSVPEGRRFTYQENVEDIGPQVAAAGIEIDIPSSEETDVWYASGSLSESIMSVPASVFRASGLKRIVIGSPPTSVNSEESEALAIMHNEDTIWVDDSYIFIRSLASMVLHNYCKAENVLAQFQQFTEESGFSYDPNHTYAYKSGEYDQWKDEYGDAFKYPDSIIDPRHDFISLFADRIDGYDWTDQEEASQNTPLAKKKELVRRIFNSIEPNGEALQQLYNYAGYAGTHGLPPPALPGRLECYWDTRGKLETEEEQHTFAMVDAGELSPHEYDFPNCDYYLSWRPDPPLANLLAPKEPIEEGLLPSYLYPQK